MTPTSIQTLETIVIRFAGDSGDGMQLAGTRFTSEAALFGNDIRTLPDFPAEIRAPQGTLAGVSSFQLQFSHQQIFTPGDAVDALVAMNPAALKMHLASLKKHGLLITNGAEFSTRNLSKVGYITNPLEDGSLKNYDLHVIDITKVTELAIEDLGLPTRTVDRCKNFFSLGLCFWLYNREIAHTVAWIEKRFAKTPEIGQANIRALKAGYFYGETTEAFDKRYDVKAAEIAPGVYRNISGNKALALGLVAAAQKSGLDLFLGAYPITPASDILHELAQYKNFGVVTFQAEDEIAGIGAAIGAAFGGSLAVTTSSGPGIALKTEALGLGVMVELPLVVVNVQRGGPSTGLPTKTEQADLLQAVFGRNSEAPIPVLAPATPSDCFDMAYEAARLAIKYRTPVMLLSDGYLANGSEPWLVKDAEKLKRIDPNFCTDAEGFKPYQRDSKTLARPWVRPGTPGLEHRIGGLEKENISGGVSYDPNNHELMVRLRAEKVQRVVQDIPPLEVIGNSAGDLLIVGWGSTYGAILGATRALQKEDLRVSCVHVRHLNPLPEDLAPLLKQFKHVMLPEMNMGQLAVILRARTLVDVQSICKIQGQPFKESEVIAKALEILNTGKATPFLAPTLEHALEYFVELSLAQAS
jgi:2-oxoglutarate/2-oxoacid ferredoxin oxidoreductase subunit alpha